MVVSRLADDQQARRGLDHGAWRAPWDFPAWSGRTRTGTPFARYRRPHEVIVTAVRWYLRLRLSAADVRDLLAERGVDVSARAGRRAATRPGTP